jgi:hypothetical protein
MNSKKEIWNNFKETKKRLKNEKSIIIVAPYFNEERLKDGYYKRVKAVDNLFDGYFKVYVTYETFSNKIEFEKHGDDTVVVRYLPESKKQKLLVALLMMACGRIYCHSVWQAKKKFFKLPGVKVYVDVHGVVPEEETLYERYEAAQMYGDIEEEVVQKAACLICVTNKIREHLMQKYGKKFKAPTIILPIFDSNLSKFDINVKDKKDYQNNKPIVIYAGGIMKWQKIELMQESINQSIDRANYIVCCPNPKEFWATWKYPKYDNLKVDTKNYADLCKDVYAIAHYGYVLRDDIVVNNVACPTKIPDYLKYRIVPIVSSPKIGDFVDLGMKYITLEDFNNGKLFTEEQIKEICDNNIEVLNKYIAVHEEGKKNFKELFK